MVKISLFALTAALATFVAADNCKAGLTYCGSSLYKKGYYDAQIRNALAAAKKSQGDHERLESLFVCTGGDNGSIYYKTTCPVKCKDAGTGKNDSC